MTEKSRTVLIALGVSLLVVALAPLLVCVGSMTGMGDMSGMMGDSEGMMMGARPMLTGGVIVLAIVVAGIVSLTVGLRRS